MNKYVITNDDGEYRREITTLDAGMAAQEWAEVTFTARDYSTYNVYAHVTAPDGSVSRWEIVAEMEPRFRAYHDEDLEMRHD